MRSIFLVLIATLALMFGEVSDASAQDTLEKIKERGTLTVGVKPDYKPWGFLDPSGEIIGFEIDLANDIAERIGVDIKLVPVTGANRMEFLNQGRIDMILATMGDNPDRRKVVGMIEPNYYAGATNILAPKAANFKEWIDIKGEKICGTQGAYYNRRVTELYEPELVLFPALPEAMNALWNGECAALLFDDTLIQSTLAGDDPKWADFEMPLVSEDPQPWAIGVRHDDLESGLGELISQASIEWHKEGKLIELERKWEMIPSPYLQEAHERHKGM